MLWFADVPALAAYLKNEPLQHCTILLKGSNGVGLERVVGGL
jgi:UDP-N-acetylmuramyl pentapeptide synthase